MVWLVKGAGKNILVDAGFLKDIPEGKDFEVVNYIRTDSALAKIALNPENITDIILTHPIGIILTVLACSPKSYLDAKGRLWPFCRLRPAALTTDPRLQGRHPGPAGYV
jgi:hypothetical protein